MYLELLQKIYDLLLTEKSLTKETLISNGITDEQINELVDNGLIYLTNKNTYNITSVNKLFLYGKKNLLQGNKRTAQTIFELCYKIKPKHRDTCLQLFYNAVLNRDYIAAYEYLYALENVSTQEHLRKDYKIYLFLLSQVSEVPTQYQEKIEAINNNQLLILHRKPNDAQKQENVVMRLIIKGKYKFAIEKLNDFLAEDYDYAVHRLIIKTLLSQIISINQKQKDELLELVKKKRYREIVSLLEEKSLTKELRTDESNILKIVRSIITIFETGSLPATIPNEATNVTEAIEYYDYEKALELETEFVVSKYLPSDKSPLYILLLEINKLMKNVTRLQQHNMFIQDNKPTIN